ncbi:MAG: hypothetical protein ABIY40_02315 [Rhodanobacteraceae bacterium]|nr:hypothetical protein [Pseudomonadota bacterium]
MRIAFSTLHPNALLPRNSLLRALLLAVGTLILFGLLAFGLIAGLALLACGAVTLLVRKLLPRNGARTGARGAGAGGVIEGEFRVVDPAPSPSLPRAKIG